MIQCFPHKNKCLYCKYFDENGGAEMTIGLLGMGTIGSGVFEIAQKLENVHVKKVLEKRFQAEYITDQIEEIVNDPEIELVV